MKSINQLTFGLSLLSTLCTSSLALPSTSKKSNINVPSTDGHLFHINGKTHYLVGTEVFQQHVTLMLVYAHRLVGTNAWWLGHLSSNADVDATISEMAQVPQADTSQSA